MLIYTDLVKEIIADMAARVDGLRRLEPDRIIVAAAGRWAGSTWGNLATCMGLGRGAEPTFSIWVRGRSKKVIEVSHWYRLEPVEIEFDGHDGRYLILLRMPRYLKHDPLETIVHELFHIGERFDGRLRAMRHGKLFDWHVKRYMQEWLERTDPRLAELARMDLRALSARFGSIVARRLPARFSPTIAVHADPPCSYEEAIESQWPGFRLARRYQVRPEELTPPSAPRKITERDCTLRSYTDEGSAEVSPSLVRYAQRPIPVGE